MKYAIIDNGGKQYRAVEGSVIEVDRMNAEVGQSVELGSVLLLVDGEKISGQIKGPKVIIFKYRPKKRIRVKTGHRQQYTRLQINSIEVE
jgi:large subunit ribosomal protein L21